MNARLRATVRGLRRSDPRFGNSLPRLRPYLQNARLRRRTPEIANSGPMPMQSDDVFDVSLFSDS